jgi:hypothetical protein
MAKGYDPFASDVEVHFQKVSPVVVRLLQNGAEVGTGRTIYKERSPLYTKPWFIATVAVVAVGVGYLAGRNIGTVPCYVNGNKDMPCN